MLGTVRGAILMLAVGGAMLAAAPGRAAPQPCAIATGGNSPVAQACADGGLIAAKRSMRDLTKRARAGGTRFECDDCHRNDTTFDLTPQARDAFKRLLSAANAASR